MRATLKNQGGLYAIGECGIVDIEAYENQEQAVENRAYKRFEKRDLFWRIYDQIIIPTREKMSTNPDHSIRLLFIEDEGNKIILHFNIDDYDEIYSEVLDVENISLDDAMKIVFADLSELKDILPVDETLKQAITHMITQTLKQTITHTRG